MRIGGCDAISGIYLFGNASLQVVTYHRGIRGGKSTFISTGIDKTYNSDMFATVRIYYCNGKPWSKDIIGAYPAKRNVL